MKSITKIVIFCVLYLGLGFCSLVLAEPIAIVVNKDNPISEMSYKDLTRTFHGHVSRWKDGQKILLVHRSLNSKPRVDFFRKVLDAKSDRELPGAKPLVSPVVIEIPSDSALLSFIASTPNAIGYLYAHKISNEVKVLKIDNYSPDQSGYPIR